MLKQCAALTAPIGCTEPCAFIAPELSKVVSIFKNDVTVEFTLKSDTCIFIIKTLREAVS